MQPPWFVPPPPAPTLPVGMQPNAPQPSPEELLAQRRTELGWVTQDPVRRAIRIVNGEINQQRVHYPPADPQIKALRARLLLGIGEVARRLGLPVADVLALESGAARMPFETYSTLVDV